MIILGEREKSTKSSYKLRLLVKEKKVKYMQRVKRKDKILEKKFHKKRKMGEHRNFFFLVGGDTNVAWGSGVEEGGFRRKLRILGERLKVGLAWFIWLKVRGI